MQNIGKESSRSDVSDLFDRDIGADKPKTHKQDAIDHFGVTSNPNHAFYMLDDGRYLNGLEEGGDPYRMYRSLDHGAIGDVYSENYSGGHEYMDRFMDEGNIRMQPETRSLSMRKKPTKEQMNAILRLVRSGKLDSIEVVRNPQWTPDNKFLEDIFSPGQVIAFLNDLFGDE